MSAIVRSVVLLTWLAVPVLHAQGKSALTVISGRLLGADGRPMAVAHAHLTSTGVPGVITEGAVAPDGSYALATTQRGAFSLGFTGVDHASTSVPLLLTGPSTILLDVQLARYRYADTLDRVLAIGDWNHFDFGTGRPMIKQPDGRYTLEVETTEDTLAYQLLGVTVENRSVNGTSADRYFYDGGGDYRSVLRVSKGKVTIVFDPRRLDRRSGEERVTWREPSGFAARFADAALMFRRVSQAYFDSSAAARARKDSLRFDWTPAVREVTSRIDRNRDPLIEDQLLLEVVEWAERGARPDSVLLARAAREVRPESPVWAFHQPFSVRSMYALARTPRATPRDYREDSVATQLALAYLDSMVARNPDRRVQSDALGAAVQLAMSVKQSERGNTYFIRLESEFPDASMLRFLKAQYAPDRVLRVGAAVPSFHFAGLADSTRSYTRESMLGKVYLLDFWATWCGPCIVDMPYLHSAFDSLHARGLEILSISLDQDPGDVTKFLSGEWKMPWQHAFARGGFNNASMRAFEIVFIPRMALVGRDGTIIAVDSDLRAEKILPTLRQAFQTTQ